MGTACPVVKALLPLTHGFHRAGSWFGPLRSQSGHLRRLLAFFSDESRRWILGSRHLGHNRLPVLQTPGPDGLRSQKTGPVQKLLGLTCAEDGDFRRTVPDELAPKSQNGPHRPVPLGLAGEPPRSRVHLGCALRELGSYCRGHAGQLWAFIRVLDLVAQFTGTLGELGIQHGGKQTLPGK